MAADFSVVLDELNTTLKSIEAVLRIDDMRSEIADLEQQAAAPDLWNDVEDGLDRPQGRVELVQTGGEVSGHVDRG